MRNFYFLIILILGFSFSVYGKGNQLAKDLRFWLKSTDTKVGTQEMISWERLVQTPVSTFKVAELTYLSYPFQNAIDDKEVKSLLNNQFKLNGLRSTRVGSAYRFEGYQKDLRRQVVIYVSKQDGKIVTTSAFYRPMYGRKLGIEVEIWHRLLHNEDFKSRFSFLKFIPTLLDKIVPSAYAQIDCSKCAGNPICLLFCQSANSGGGGSPSTGTIGGVLGGGSSSGGGGLFDFGGMDLTGLTEQLGNINSQLTVLNGNVADANVNWGNSNTNWNNSNQNWQESNKNWQETNNQLNTANNNWAETNNQLNTANNNWAQTNKQLEEANKNFADLNKIVDQRSKEAIETMKSESEAWRNLMDKHATRALDISEKMTDPKHLFKMAAASAAGAVVGATAVNLAISGVKSILGFLVKWANGDLKKMKQEEILKEFEQAMKVYSQSEPLAKNLERQIDETLASIALYKKFKFDNVDVLPNLQKSIIETEFKIEDAKKDRCVDDIVELNKQLVEFQSLSKILTEADPLPKICADLKDSFRKLSEAEGLLQNARPNLLKAEEVLNSRKADAQNDASDELDKLKKNKMSRKVSKVQDKQMENLYMKNVKDSELLLNDVKRDCRASFEKALKKKLIASDVKKFCDKILVLSSNEDEMIENLKKTFPGMDETEVYNVHKQFAAKYIPMGLEKYRKYETEREDLFKDFENEVDRHKTEVRNLKDRMDLNPEIALNEMAAINKFIEKIMKEQAMLFTKGLKDREAKIDEACLGVGNKFEVEPESKKKLESAIETIDELEGSTVGNTVINCDPRMLRLDCAEKLQTLAKILKNKESKIPRIVLTPSHEIAGNSVLYRDKSNPALQHMRINSRLDEAKMSQIISKREEALSQK